MALPAGVSSVTVSGRFIRGDGQPCRGKVTFTPSRTLTGPGTTPPVVMPPAPVVALLNTSGAFSVVLAATDDADLEPTPWTYAVVEEITGQAPRFYSIELPASPSTVDLADLAPVAEPEDVETYDQRYLRVAGGTMAGALTLSGPPTQSLHAATKAYVDASAGGGEGGAVASVNGQTGVVELDAGDVSADPAGTAASAVSAHAGDTTDVHGIANTAALETTSGATAKVSAHAGASDPHGDRANAASLYLPKAYTASVEPAAPVAEWHVNYETDPSDSPDLFRIFNNGVKKTWWNENGSVRGEAAKIDEAAARWYGLSGQTADIWQVLDTRTNAAVLACVKPNGNLVITGSFQGANGAWTVLTSNDGDYTAVDANHAEWQPAVRLVGPANETVQMRGRFTVTNTVLNDVMTVLPSQFRPSKTVRISLANGQSTAIHGFIDTSGNVTIGRAVTSAGWLSLDGVQFSRV
ncbi:hypothetical protein [Herbidospora daliensis]|uniref:hypothetical protein n=1 Tax=Herbidospora daliensis TaxID=295585 RepID=UPI0007842807|nr:hypothetical protein [Herbidospora daliensis]